MRLGLIVEKRVILTNDRNKDKDNDKDHENKSVPSINAVDNKITRRSFLRKTATAAASVNPLLKFLISGGMQANVVKGLEAGKTIPFLIRAVSNPGRGVWDNLSQTFTDINNVASIARRISDEGLISGAEEHYYIGGRIGLDKLIAIAKAAKRNSTVNIAGMEYEVYDDDDFIELVPKEGFEEITIFKNEDDYKDTYGFGPMQGNVIQTVWNEYLKYGGEIIDKEAINIINQYDLDLSEWQDQIPDGLTDKSKDEKSKVNEKDSIKDYSRNSREYYGSMHQMYESLEKRLDRIFNDGFYLTESEEKKTSSSNR